MQTTQKNIYIIIAIILFVFFAVVWKNGSLNNYLPFFMTTDGWNKYEREINTQEQDESSIVSVIYHSGQESLAVNFNNSHNTVTFTHPKTGTITLPQAISASGARYANADESIVFWEHQGEGSLSVSSIEVFKGTLNSNAPSDENTIMVR
ncbi:MliC family protein [Candidatus Kaiserbacteria bacterium]|nr:MAG: MliC family protein [Candidatus Kaiserbacteria bacterium]